MVRTVPLRVGAEQGPASSPRCDVGHIVASITVTSEKRHDDLSFGGEKKGVTVVCMYDKTEFPIPRL